jgi:ankyrin repeat protein
MDVIRQDTIKKPEAWVILALHMLGKEATEDLQRLLQELPQDPEATYTHFLGKVPSGRHELTTELYWLVIAAFRPSAVNDDITSSRRAGDEYHSLVDFQQNQLRTGVVADNYKVSQPLKEPDSKVLLVLNSLIGLLHATIHRTSNENLQANLFLASACMTYLSIDEFAADLSGSLPQSISPTSSRLISEDTCELENLEDSTSIFKTLFQEDEELLASAYTIITQRFDFFEYSAKSWALHFAECQHIAPQSLKDLAIQLTAQNTMVFPNWFRFMWTRKDINRPVPSNVDALLIAGFFNHHVSIDTILTKEHSPDQDSLANALHWASRNGCYSSVLKLLQTAVEPDSITVDQQSSLCIAAQLGHHHVVASLAADARVDTNFKGKGRRTPLSLAAGNGHGSIVELLLSNKNTKVNFEDNRGRTPLFWAVDGRDLVVLRSLMSDQRTEINHVDNDGRTPLSWAAEQGDVDVLAILLSSNHINIDQADSHGRTPLSWAAGQGRTSFIERLKCDKRCKTSHSHKDHSKRNAISWAAGEGHNSTIELLVKSNVPGMDEEDDSKWTPLFWALEAQTNMTITTLLDTGLVNVNHRDHSGRTALSWVAGYGNKAMLQTLLAAQGIDATATDNVGQTPLDWAQKFKMHGTTSILENIIVKNNQ